MPQIVIIAGPNGAGKSTLAVRFVPRGIPSLNADEIAVSVPSRWGLAQTLRRGCVHERAGWRQIVQEEQDGH